MLEYAIITPTYAPDFERCRLLVESVRRHVAQGIEHILVVDDSDAKLFGSLKGPHTRILVTEDFLPWWLQRVPFWPRWWMNLKGRPNRGWVIQQLVKLSVDAVTSAEVCVFLDSDCFLVDRFDPRVAEREGKVPLFVEDLPEEIDFNTDWLARADALCGLPASQNRRVNYVTNAVVWRRSNVIALHRRVEEVSGKGWHQTLFPLRTLSEYTLYGTFCQRVLGDASGHYPEPKINILSHWPNSPLDERGLAGLRGKLRPEHVGVMISSKSGTSVAAVARAFDLRP